MANTVNLKFDLPNRMEASKIEGILIKASSDMDLVPYRSDVCSYKVGKGGEMQPQQYNLVIREKPSWLKEKLHMKGSARSVVSLSSYNPYNSLSFDVGGKTPEDAIKFAKKFSSTLSTYLRE